LCKLELGKMKRLAIFRTDFRQLYKPFCSLWVKGTPVLLFQGKGGDVIILNTENHWEAAAKL